MSDKHWFEDSSFFEYSRGLNAGVEDQNKKIRALVIDYKINQKCEPSVESILFLKRLEELIGDCNE